MNTSQPATNGELITGRHAKLYDLRQPIWRYVRRGHLANVQLKPNDKLLDIGCGTGNTLMELFHHYSGTVKLYGVEPSQDMLSQAQARLGKNSSVQLKQATAELLPFADNYFDYVTCSLVFHHLPLEAKLEALTEMRRVLKLGGTLVLSDWEKPTNLLGKIIGFAWRNHAFVRENLQGPFVSILQEAGFKNIQTGSVQAGIVHHFSAQK